MEPLNQFFYKYINILINQGCSKYDAIDRYLWDPTIPENYKHMSCIQEEMIHAIKLLNENNGSTENIS